MSAAFLPPDEQRRYDSTVHGLRSQGWGRFDAEAEAIARIDAARRRGDDGRIEALERMERGQ